jgi:hypothetical protein
VQKGTDLVWKTEGRKIGHTIDEDIYLIFYLLFIYGFNIGEVDEKQVVSKYRNHTMHLVQLMQLQ